MRIDVCAHDASIRHQNDPVGEASRANVVRHNHDRDAVTPRHVRKILHHLTPTRAVQRRCWFISENDRGSICERTRYRHPLLFAAR